MVKYRCLWVSHSIRSQIFELAATSFPNETGGVLLGYEAENGELVLTRIFGPGPNASHSRTSFHPDHEYQKAELASHFLATGGRESYFGDWHTHPLGIGQLSDTDRRTLRRIAETPAAQVCRPIMAVLAGGPSDWGFHVEQYVNQGAFFGSYGRLRALEVVFWD